MKQKLNKSRTTWLAPEMKPYDNRSPMDILTGLDIRHRVPEEESNVVSSRLGDDEALLRAHMPIVDLDYPHEYVPSSTPGHAHLYLNVEIGRARWICLMLGLWIGGVVSRNYMLWSFRRMANYARQPWVSKADERRIEEF